MPHACLFCEQERIRYADIKSKNDHAFLVQAFGPEIAAIVEATNYNPPPLVVLDMAGKIVNQVGRE